MEMLYPFFPSYHIHFIFSDVSLQLFPLHVTHVANETLCGRRCIDLTFVPLIYAKESEHLFYRRADMQ